MVLTKLSYPIEVTRQPISRLNQLNLSQVAFGSVMSDHMFVAEYHQGAWQQGHILPYGALELGPALSALNYGQSIFEGMKAFRDVHGKVSIFRMLDHHERLNRSGERLCMPYVPKELFTTALQEVVALDAEWVPATDGSALYLRPLLFASDEYIGVRPSQNYVFAVVCCPVNRYYNKPLKAVTTKYVRAAEGGVGYVKMAGNYATSMLAGVEAKQEGFDVVLFLDAKEHRYAEEFSTMNGFFLIDGVLITPTTDHGTILKGITRDSLIQLARRRGIEVQERDIALDEVLAAAAQGRLQEAFGAGTAAVVSFIESITHEGHTAQLPPVAEWKVSPALEAELAAIRLGTQPDEMDWMWPVN